MNAGESMIESGGTAGGGAERCTAAGSSGSTAAGAAGGGGGGSTLVSMGLSVQALGKQYTPDAAKTVVSQARGDNTGNTSVRNSRAEDLDWKVQGYFTRNRDLGQVFAVGPQAFKLDAIVLRTGMDDGAVRPGAIGAEVFMQFFKVSGTPSVNDNGTPTGTRATHGFGDGAYHRTDDFIEGMSYEPLLVATGGKFPAIPETQSGGSEGMLYYMRWDLLGEAELSFEPNQRYAFMIGFVEPGPQDRAFTLANRNDADDQHPPELDDNYPLGFGLRREGNGKPISQFYPGAMPPASPPEAELRAQALFPAGAAHYAISPTTDGYPDVDTYRDFQFYLEKH